MCFAPHSKKLFRFPVCFFEEQKGQSNGKREKPTTELPEHTYEEHEILPPPLVAPFFQVGLCEAATGNAGARQRLLRVSKRGRARLSMCGTRGASRRWMVQTPQTLPAKPTGTQKGKKAEESK